MKSGGSSMSIATERADGVGGDADQQRTDRAAERHQELSSAKPMPGRLAGTTSA